MKLVKIPENRYDEYRMDVIFDGYKWDPQFLDNNTIAKHVLVLSEDEHQELTSLVEKLGQETEIAEKFINNNQKFSKKLKLSRKTRKQIHRITNYDSNQHIRLMRFDFHPTIEGGWAISEVNSDVPGGFAEGSLMPKIVAQLFNDEYSYVSFAEILINSIVSKVKPNGRIMLVHCTSYSDDRQVMQFIGDQLTKLGFETIYGAADHVNFKDNYAYSILDNNQGIIDGIVRFNPMEWVVDIKPTNWYGYFNTLTPSCNHPIAVYTQSKRFPLIWDDLEREGIDLSTWRKLLPETIEVKHSKNRTGFIYKPVWGRVGEGISIVEACRDDEYEKIMKEVKRHPNRYIAQSKFISLPLLSEGKEYHVCLGAYYVDGNAAGYYARISNTTRIDSHAADIPVLIERKVK